MKKVDEITQDFFDSMPDDNASLVYSARKIADEYKRMRALCRKLYPNKAMCNEAMMMIQKALVIFVKDYTEEQQV